MFSFRSAPPTPAPCGCTDHDAFPYKDEWTFDVDKNSLFATQFGHVIPGDKLDEESEEDFHRRIGGAVGKMVKVKADAHSFQVLAPWTPVDGSDGQPGVGAKRTFQWVYKLQVRSVAGVKLPIPEESRMLMEWEVLKNDEGAISIVALSKQLDIPYGDTFITHVRLCFSDDAAATAGGSEGSKVTVLMKVDFAKSGFLNFVTEKITLSETPPLWKEIEAAMRADLANANANEQAA
ncbi:hypothetical protein M427DRAFT_54987 [Gonapodya prolifera JEL478]|uniref:VASt domain-containing protein n=1 Tax=Gonapodya prolifera (strain JEL478) TaxID=1344416 RepID=A0A139AKK2_GONPJ|nr:hypothetical protein M427DRAFT_54987 [Gonapodya prolifera JEL478]|eukprot:KXS16955.1 hypothetical protein M427DRAFT_54987 [Gonapodya prolifera JEL478]